MITIYDYEWAGDDDGPTWAPFEAAVLEIAEGTLTRECGGDVARAVEGGHAEHTGGYVVAAPSDVPQGVRVYGDAAKEARGWIASILGDPDTLALWADERRIDIMEAESILAAALPEGGC